LGDHPEGAEDPVLERPHRGVHQGAAAVDPLPGEVHWQSSFRIGPGAGVMEAGWQAPARQLQSRGELRDLSRRGVQTIETVDRGKPPRPALFIDSPYEPREGHLAGSVAYPIPQSGPKACAVRPRKADGRGADVEVHREGGGDVDERQAQMFGHRPTRLLDLI